MNHDGSAEKSEDDEGSNQECIALKARHEAMVRSVNETRESFFPLTVVAQSLL